MSDPELAAEVRCGATEIRVTHPFEALVDGGLADTEVAGGVGLRVTGLNVGFQRVVRDFRTGHDLPSVKQS